MKLHACTISLLAALTVAGAVPAQAPAQKQVPAETPKIDFASVDKDANGRLSKQEAMAIADLDGVFDKLDTDHDGSVSPVEFSHWDRAGRANLPPRDPATVPGGSAGAQHMPPGN